MLYMKYDKNILPIADPPIKSYHSCDLLSIILNHDSENFLINNYIQVFSMKIEKTFAYHEINYYMPFDLFSECPFINCQKISHQFIPTITDDIVDFFIHCIDNGYYIFTDYDQYYISKTPAYNSRHFYHDLFIYGYDRNKKVLHCTEFLDLKGYCYIEAGFDEFRTSYNAASKCNECKNGVMLLKYEEKEHRINIEYLKQTINDYIHEKNSYIRFYPNDSLRMGQKQYIYGMAVYDNIKYYINKTLKNDPNEVYLKLFFVLLEHKKMMLSRIKRLGERGYLQNSQYIYSKYKPIYEMAGIAENLHNKYIMTKNPEILIKLDSLINKIRDAEPAVLTMFSDCLGYKFLEQEIKINEDEYPPFTENIDIKSGEIKAFENKSLSDLRELRWEITNDDIIEIYELRYSENILELKAKNTGNCEIIGYDKSGKKQVIYHVACCYPGLITNINHDLQCRGEWKITNEGLFGKGKDQFILVNKCSENFILKCDVELLSQSSGPSIVFKARRDFEYIYAICIHRPSHTIILWEHGKAFKTVPFNLQKNIYHVEIIVTDSTVRVFFNNEMILEYEGIEVKKGYIGFISVDEVIFNNIDYLEIDSSDNTDNKLSENCFESFCGEFTYGAKFFMK